MRKVNASHLEKGLLMSLENCTKICTTTMKQDESEQELGEDEHKSSTDVH